MSTYAELGTVSHGTLRSVDLLEAFADTLEPLAKAEYDEGYKSAETFDTLTHVQKRYNDFKTLIKEASECDCNDHYRASALVEDLTDALNEFAPPYCYFGTHEGDGSDFGFWVSHDALNDACHDKEVLKLDDPLPDCVLVVNDHGNMTLYRVKLEEIWGVV